MPFTEEYLSIANIGAGAGMSLHRKGEPARALATDVLLHLKDLPENSRALLLAHVDKTGLQTMETIERAAFAACRALQQGDFAHVVD